MSGQMGRPYGVPDEEPLLARTRAECRHGAALGFWPVFHRSEPDIDMVDPGRASSCHQGRAAPRKRNDARKASTGFVLIRRSREVQASNLSGHWLF